MANPSLSDRPQAPKCPHDGQTMSVQRSTADDELTIRELLMSWASATRQGRQDEVLINHAPDVLIYDVLSPMKYESAAAYRRSWDDWQPDTQGESRFEIEDLSVTAAADLAFVHGFIQCGGTLPSGRRFQDTVRATFCLGKVDGQWQVQHQHISNPMPSR